MITSLGSPEETHALHILTDAMPTPTRGPQLGFLLLCALLKNCPAVQNDATEMLTGHIIPLVQETPANGSLNRARNGGRSLDTSAKLGGCFILLHLITQLTYRWREITQF